MSVLKMNELCNVHAIQAYFKASGAGLTDLATMGPTILGYIIQRQWIMSARNRNCQSKIRDQFGTLLYLRNYNNPQPRNDIQTQV